MDGSELKAVVKEAIREEENRSRLNRTNSYLAFKEESDGHVLACRVECECGSKMQVGGRASIIDGSDRPPMPSKPEGWPVYCDVCETWRDVTVDFSVNEVSSEGK